jgi:hypothetical protein
MTSPNDNQLQNPVPSAIASSYISDEVSAPPDSPLDFENPEEFNKVSSSATIPPLSAPIAPYNQSKVDFDNNQPNTNPIQPQSVDESSIEAVLSQIQRSVTQMSDQQKNLLFNGLHTLIDIIEGKSDTQTNPNPTVESNQMQTLPQTSLNNLEVPEFVEDNPSPLATTNQTQPIPATEPQAPLPQVQTPILQTTLPQQPPVAPATPVQAEAEDELIPNPSPLPVPPQTPPPPPPASIAPLPQTPPPPVPMTPVPQTSTVEYDTVHPSPQTAADPTSSSVQAPITQPGEVQTPNPDMNLTPPVLEKEEAEELTKAANAEADGSAPPSQPTQSEPPIDPLLEGYHIPAHANLQTQPPPVSPEQNPVAPPPPQAPVNPAQVPPIQPQ